MDRFYLIPFVCLSEYLNRDELLSLARTSLKNKKRFSSEAKTICKIQNIHEGTRLFNSYKKIRFSYTYRDEHWPEISFPKSSLVELTLVDLNLPITLLTEMTNLTRLRLAGNHYINFELAHIPNSLRKLEIHEWGIISSHIKNLTNLESLDIVANELIDDAGISNLTNLKSLSVPNNRLISNAAIENLTLLESLNIEGNCRWISNWGLRRLKNIESLNLDSNSDITWEGYSHLTKLSSLNMSYNNQASTLPKLPNLKILMASFCVNLDERSLMNETNLTALNISGTRLTGSCFKHLPNLTSLNIFYTKLSGEGLRYLTNLRKLFLGQQSGVCDEDIKYLISLRELNLYSNKMITNDGIKHLTNLSILDRRESLVTKDLIFYKRNWANGS
ncbi:MAG: hypothetical protein Harvfovirus1_61 [Harvfovirus sp.]|uniref:Leucine-rich repeat protein n=1 Tax=Harvfovirus sp. TaxID=2487768 RepID=A0A3G4ZZP0_9VIRU|nr:MAG: hypothetical protein Harvfovirus1_61 [Harvfovirus sp.]